MVIHTKQTENPDIDESICLFCNKKFSNKYNCARHMVTCALKPMIDATNPMIDAANPMIDAANPMIDAANPMISSQDQTKHEFQCRTCYKSYTRASYLDAHVPKCKHIQHPLECEKCHHIFSGDGNLSVHRKTCKGVVKTPMIPQEIIEGNDSQLINNNQMNVINININNTQNNQTNNINVNNFGHENKSHIDPVFIEKCLRGIFGDGVPNMVKKLHLDPNVPENHNVQIYSKKQSLMKIKEEDGWNIKDRNDVVDKVINNSVASLFNTFHSPESTIKKEDEEKHFNAIAIRMLEISNKLPKVHFPLRRKVYALVLNFCEQLTDITKGL